MTERKSRFIALAMAVCMVLTALFAAPFPSSAYNSWKGTVSADRVNVRTGPGTVNPNVKTTAGTNIRLSTGASVTVKDAGKASDGATWYNISFTYTDGLPYEGWIHSAYVEAAPSEEVDEAFEAHLTEQGFPESYKPALRSLHAKYPDWIFTAFHTGLDWNASVKEESVLGRSLTLNTHPSSWKSTQPGAYNWDTDEWIVFDSGGFVQASEGIIAYYLDPRNYLTSSGIFAFLQLSYQEDVQTPEGLQLVLSGTFLDDSITDADGTELVYADVIMEAAKQSGVSPYVLAATMQQEQGSGVNNNISGTCEPFVGYYNYFNIGAYRTDEYTAAQRGLWFASGCGRGETTYLRPWNTRRKSIIGGSIWYGEKYVAAGQNTLYLKKYNVQGKSPYTHQYMTYVGGAMSEAGKLAKAYSSDEVRTAALSFAIPVFTDMPASACPVPVGDGSPNNYLSALSVDGAELTPSFDRTEQEYSLIVPYETESVTVRAQAVSKEAKIAGTGAAALSVGINDLEVVVTAGNGDKRTYRLTVARQDRPDEPEPTEPEPTEPEPTDPEPTEPEPTEPEPTEPVTTQPPAFSYRTDLVESGDLLYGAPGIPVTAGEILAMITVENGTAALRSAAGADKAPESGAATGDRVVLTGTDGTEKTFTLVLFGDVNGDGRVTSTDILKAQRHILKLAPLTGAPALAADANHSGSITSTDLLTMQRHVLKLSVLKQK